jgi:ABC-type dipeptide/oligopeptide/nickel transport system permease component
LLPVTAVVGLRWLDVRGAVLVEYIFSWPGLNSLLLNSLGAGTTR